MNKRKFKYTEIHPKSVGLIFEGKEGQTKEGVLEEEFKDSAFRDGYKILRVHNTYEGFIVIVWVTE